MEKTSSGHKILKKILTTTVILALSAVISVRIQKYFPTGERPIPNSKNLPRILAKNYHVPDDGKLTLEPSGISITIPEEWVDHYRKESTNLYLTKDVFDIVQNGNFEWNNEPVAITDTILPFENMQAEMGGFTIFPQQLFYPLDGPIFTGVFVRVYSVSTTPKTIEKIIENTGFTTAQNFSRSFTTTTTPILKKIVYNDWQRAVLTFDLTYGDYDGLAQIDFWIKRFGHQTVVLVFMGNRGNLQTQTKEEKLKQRMSSSVLVKDL